jgi:hypothetical protein
MRRFCPIAPYESECLQGERPRAWDLFLTSHRSRSLEGWIWPSSRSLIASGQKNLHNGTSNTQRIQMIMMWMMNLNVIFFIHSLIQWSLWNRLGVIHLKQFFFIVFLIFFGFFFLSFFFFFYPWLFHFWNLGFTIVDWRLWCSEWG